LSDIQGVGFSHDNNGEDLRKRLRQMSNEELHHEIRAATYMCSPQVNFGNPPLEVFVVYLSEAREELKWRNKERSI
jgi:hypothetical protein